MQSRSRGYPELGDRRYFCMLAEHGPCCHATESIVNAVCVLRCDQNIVSMSSIREVDNASSLFFSSSSPRTASLVHHLRECILLVSLQAAIHSHTKILRFRQVRTLLSSMGSWSSRCWARVITLHSQTSARPDTHVCSLHRPFRW